MTSVSAVGVIDKAVVILQAIGARPRDLSDLQASTGLPRATAHRLTVALEDHGLVRRDAQGRFCLGFAMISLGRSAAEQFPLGQSARPALDALGEDTGESVQLYIREGAARRCVVSLQSPHALRWIVPEGSLLPLDVGSAGRVLSGGAEPHDWVESVEEREPGVASVSAPVRGPDGTIVAAVSVSGPIERLTRSPGRRLGVRILLAATQIERVLGA